MLSLTGRTLEGVLDDLRRVAQAIDLAEEGDELVAGLRSRLDRLRSRRPASRARVACVEWLAPVYLAGHWVPDLVAAAGGVDVGARAGGHSAVSTWEAIAGLRPDLVLVMVCGFDVARTREELDRLRVPAAARLFGSVPVWLLDGNAYTSRPGPRIVDGAERLQCALNGLERGGLVRWRPAR
jgi:iron complex transport system substrate-binding protein